MKRSRSIQLAQFRKYPTKLLKVKPLCLAVSAAILASCSAPSEEAIVATSPNDCANKSKLTLQQCEAAYKKAVAEAERTSPKYKTSQDCELEFGANKCQATSSGSYMPLLAGFLIGQTVADRYNPVYTYYGAGSYRNRLMTSDGSVLNPGSNGRYNVPKGTTSKTMPTVSRTISRGGFGSSASAKSSWGGSSGSKGGWGG